MFELICLILIALIIIPILKELGIIKPHTPTIKPPPPVRLVYDNTKLNPWCVEKFDGETYVRVTGWFAKEENAREVYNRLVKETSTSFNSSDQNNSTSQDNSTSYNSSDKTYHFYNSQSQNNSNS